MHARWHVPLPLLYGWFLRIPDDDFQESAVRSHAPFKSLFIGGSQIVQDLSYLRRKSGLYQQLLPSCHGNGCRAQVVEHGKDLHQGGPGVVLVVGRTIVLDADGLIRLGKGGPQLVFDDRIHHEGKAHDKAQGLYASG